MPNYKFCVKYDEYDETVLVLVLRVIKVVLGAEDEEKEAMIDEVAHENLEHVFYLLVSLFIIIDQLLDKLVLCNWFHFDIKILLRDLNRFLHTIIVSLHSLAGLRPARALNGCITASLALDAFGRTSRVAVMTLMIATAQLLRKAHRGAI